jgi:hypothetical protein
MSLYYTHMLIPTLPHFRPGVDDVVQFLNRMIGNGHVADNPTIEVAPVSKVKPVTRQMRNPFTGESIDIRSPSWKTERRIQLSETSQIAGECVNQPEFDVSIGGMGMPLAPPLAVGLSTGPHTWNAMDSRYHLEVRCRVRANIVRLSAIQSEEDLHKLRRVDLSLPRFGEDCSADERDGLFVHPECGAIRIPNAGCGMFWIEFNYGKFIFPRVKDGGIDVLAGPVLNLARTTFDCEFIQACSWG